MAEQKPKTIYALQIGRGLAAMLVVFFHTTITLQTRGLADQLPKGGVGVDIFFVISGFVIYLTGRKLDWREFLARRIVRVVPLYWFFITLKLATILVSGSDPTGSTGNPGFVIGSYLFVPVYRQSMNDIYPVIAAGWTLNYEMYFYAVTAIVIAALPRRWMAIAVTSYIAAAAIAGIVLFGAIPTRTFPPLVLLQPICLEFVAGIWIAAAWTKGPRLGQWASLGLVAAATLIWACATTGALAHSPWRALGWGVPAAAFVLGLVNLDPVVAFGRWKAALLVGDASYSIYLVHTAVLPIFDHVVRRLPANVWLQGAALMIASAFAGILVHKLIEKPLLRWGSRLLRLKVSDPAPVSAIKA